MNRRLQIILSTLYNIKAAGSVGGIYTAAKFFLRQKEIQSHSGRETFPTKEECQRQQKEAASFPADLKFSILVPLYNTPEAYLREMLKSVFEQTCSSWELCLADGSDAEHGDLKEKIDGIAQSYHIPKEKIRYRRLQKNGGISENTNACLELATGNFLVPFDHDDYLHPEVLYRYAKIILEQGADYLYCDEATFQNDNLDDIITVHLKPDYAVDNLRANNYICHLSCFRRSLIDEEPKIRYRSEFDGSQDHDLILRVTARARKIVHVPSILYYWRAHEGSTASALEEKGYAIDAAKRAVEDSLRTAGYQSCTVESSRAAKNIFHIFYPVPEHPSVSLILPEGGRGRAEQIRTAAGLPDLEIQFYADSSGARAAAMNRVAEQAGGEYLLFLRANVVPKDAKSLRELLMYAQRRDVGAVGGCIISHKRIESAGLVLGAGEDSIARPYYGGWPVSSTGYMGRLCYAQDISVLSCDCMMIKKSLFEQVGGFEEGYRESGFDLDLCFRLRSMGLWNVADPYAVFENHGRRISGYPFGSEDKARFLSKWGKKVANDDLFCNENTN
jgi:glycosyltransferase involved in cell wall biosynthesis